MKIYDPLQNAFISQSFDLSAIAPATELHKVAKNTKRLKLNPAATGGETRDLDINAWLPLASVEYNISPDIRDYVIAPIPAMITSIPNTNGDCAETKDMLKFNVQQGRPAYKTFAGKPTFEEHANTDHTVAKGIILDSYLTKLPGYNGRYARLMMLLAFDRTRDPRIANSILNNTHNAFSMGMYYNSYQCSVCGHTVHQDTMQLCSHTKPQQATYRNSLNQLVYRMCKNITGFECSYVADPAFVSAINRPEHVLDPRSL